MLKTATFLADQGHDVDLVTASAEQAANNQPDKRLNHQTFGTDSVRSAVPGLIRHLRAQRPDVLLTAMDHANVVGLVAARLSATQVPVVISFRNDILSARRNRSLFSYLRPQVARWSIRFADHVIAISNGVRDGLVQLAPRSRDKITTIYNPTVDARMLELAAEPIAEELGFDLGETVLAVGRLTPQKGLDLLVEAFARVVAVKPDTHLLILGEGPLRPELRQLARALGLADRLHLAGYAANPYQYMAQCRVFALSSRWEGLGNVLVEAGALGCTIVATNCPSGPYELLHDRPQATLVAVDDAAALADALINTLQGPRRRWESNWDEHTITHNGQRYEAVLLEVASRRAARAAEP